jgi:hypothetical protein
MGFLKPALEMVDFLVKHRGVKTACDLGDQVNFVSPKQTYMSVWYKENGVEYMSIDLNGKNDSKQWDMGDVIKTNKKFDLVTNCGFSEHVKNMYQCFANIHKLTKVEGYMLHETPRTGNWPLHAHHYLDEGFYEELSALTGYRILELKNTVAMHNYDTGNNVFCLLQKVYDDPFIEREQFPKTYTE